MRKLLYLVLFALFIFLAYQYPMEVPGVTNSDFIRQAMKSTSGKSPSLFTFVKEFDKAIQEGKEICNIYTKLRPHK